MKRIIYLLLFVCTNFVFSQTIKGTVVNEYNTPVDYLFVVHKKTNTHTHTNAQGRFSLENVSIGDTLVFQKLGFKTKKITCTSKALNVQITTESIALDQVVLSSKVNASSIITSIDVQTTPVKSSQELLTKVPGLIIGQHAGGGKAEQLFYRGFDIDHGTDLQVVVDGLPVNMVSHAHGQGYADLHFVIPETVKDLDFKAGTYDATQGNFATTGTVNIISKEALTSNILKLEVGDFNTQRLLFMNQFLKKPNESAYVATEYIKSDGPFESPQNFTRFNINSKYTKTIKNTKLGVTFSHFESNWNASGQIPQRAVDNGSISRFGAIDDTEGGETSRTNLALTITNKNKDNSELKHLLYYTNYKFDLFSNFTFFLENPVDGDQIRQQENRTIFGYQSDYKKRMTIAHKKVLFTSGIGVRMDKVKDNQLSSTKNKTEILNRIQYGDVNETNAFGYISGDISLGNWNLIPALRVDYFSFGYQDFLATSTKLEDQTSVVVSPKLSLLYSPTSNFQAYTKIGQGFHTNDSRLVLNSLGNDIPKAYTTDVGFIWRTHPKLLVGLGTWAMYSEQEFVYVGDAGVVEPNGASKRVGASVNTRYQPITSLFLNFDANYTYARFADEPDGEDYVPLAPSFTLKGSATYKSEKGFYGGIDFLHLADRPANEDNSIVAKGYTLTNLNVGYRWHQLDIGVQIQNLFDVEWNETQFATESRLANETASVEEIHFTPGAPLFFKTSIAYKF